MIGYVAEVIRTRPLDVRITAMGPQKGKWRGVINIHDETGRFSSRLHMSDQEYDTRKKAIAAMDYITKQVTRKKRMGQ